MRLTIGKQSYFNNGELIIEYLKDADGNPLKAKVEEWLIRDYSLSMHQYKGRKGIKAAELNEELREYMPVIEGVHGETHLEYGCLFHMGKEGFDFSIYDEKYNLQKMRNVFIGYPGRYNGNEELYSLYKRMAMTKKAWTEKLVELGGNPGSNIPEEKKILTVVGELQFGNWALSRHDLLRLLNTSEEYPIDYYIYIAATGKLARLLSSGIVTYEKVLDVVNENKGIIKIPMWVIGLDINEND